MHDARDLSPSAPVPNDRVRAVLTELLSARGVALDAEALAQSLVGLGLDSLHVVELQLELEEAFAIELGAADQVERALGTMSVAELIALVEARLAQPRTA